MRKRRNTPRIILTCVITVLIIAGAGYFGYAFFQVEKTEIEGNGKYTSIYIEGLANIEPDTHMMSLDEEQVALNIEESEPYLEVLSVTKKLPHTVMIQVKERQPKAYIVHAQQYLLTDQEANILDMLDQLPETLEYPVVTGFTITGAALGKQITTEDTFKITVLGEILVALENRKNTQTIVEIDLSDVNSIRMLVSTGLTIKFGQADKIMEKMALIDRMLPQLSRDGRKTGVLDVATGEEGYYRPEFSEEGSTGQMAGKDDGAANDTDADGDADTGGTESDTDADTNGNEDNETPNEDENDTEE